MPLSLDKAWHARPYYGELAHNIRSIYVHYQGDANAIRKLFSCLDQLYPMFNILEP